MRVVVVSPFPADRDALEELLRDEGHEVTSVASRDEGLALATTSRPDVIIAEAQLPGHDGLVLVRELARRGVPPHTILLCARSDRMLAELGVVCMIKPIDLTQLFRHVARHAPARPQVA